MSSGESYKCPLWAEGAERLSYADSALDGYTDSAASGGDTANFVRGHGLTWRVGACLLWLIKREPESVKRMPE